jgi:pimeloyl-ACP methyl ester carboxylesterase
MSVPRRARSERALMIELCLLGIAGALVVSGLVSGVLMVALHVACGLSWTAGALLVGSLAVAAFAVALRHADRRGVGLATRIDRRSGRGGTRLTATAYDGTPLHIEVDGPDDAELTVVFSHGWMSDLTTWRLQRAALRGTTLRRVFYDQRGHGRSSWTALDGEEEGVRQLADDLHAVIEAVAPTGQLLLVGHSMGGMAVIAFAGRYPDLMHQRVDGILLCATTAAPLAESITLGIPDGFDRTHRFVRRYAVPALRILGMLPPGLVQRVARAGALFGTPLDVGSRCLAALLAHDERDSLGGLDPTRVTVVIPGRDRLVPRSDQLEIAALVGGARVATAPNSGHMVTLEAADLVTAELLGLVVIGMDRPANLLAAS